MQGGKEQIQSLCRRDKIKAMNGDNITANNTGKARRKKEGESNTLSKVNLGNKENEGLCTPSQNKEIIGMIVR